MKAFLLTVIIALSATTASANFVTLNCKNENLNLEVNLNQKTKSITAYLSDSDGYSKHKLRLDRKKSQHRATFVKLTKSSAMQLTLPLTVLQEAPTQTVAARLHFVMAKGDFNHHELTCETVEDLFTSEGPVENTDSRIHEIDDHKGRHHLDSESSIDFDGQATGEFSDLF